MNDKIKYLTILILALAVSATTSYVTTTSLQPPQQTSQNPLQQDPEQQKRVTVPPPYEVHFSIDYSIVRVYSNDILNNLTIVYDVTCLNGTKFTRSVDYGTYIPAWGIGATIRQGDIPSNQYVIPDDIISVSSTHYTTSNGITLFGTGPLVEIQEVYGYT